jgi:hypothetical protein
MGSLVVENNAGAYTITGIAENGSNQSGLNISNGQSSAPISLPVGAYTVTVTLQDKAGETHTVEKKVVIEEGAATVLPINTSDLNPEPKTPVPPNLVKGNGGA